MTSMASLTFMADIDDIDEIPDLEEGSVTLAAAHKLVLRDGPVTWQWRAAR